MQPFMTLAQTSFWKRFVQQPSATVDTVAHAVLISGELDIETFALAIQHTLRETDVFRTQFHRAGDMSIMPIETTPTVEVHDFSHLTKARNRAWKEMEQDVEKAVNLLEKPLTLHRLYQLAPKQFCWYTRAHHILLDGYGMMLFEQRCCQWYQHLHHNHPLKAAFKPYQDYLAEEAHYCKSTKYQIDKAFWKQYLHSGELKLTDTDYDLNASCEISHQVLFEPHFSSRLKDICQTLTMGWPDALVAITALYLQQSPLSEENESVVWLPFMNRWGSVAAKMPGLMVNIVPYRHKLAPLNCLKDYLLHCQTALRELYSHGRYRVEQIERDQGLAPHQNYFMTPFINVMPFDAPCLPGCKMEHQVLAAGSAEGLNITFRGAPGSEQFCAFIEADIHSYPQAKLDQHALDLAVFFERLLDSGEKEVHRLEHLLNRPLTTLLNGKSALAKSA